MSLQSIPKDVLQLIGDKLKFSDLMRFKKTCKYAMRLNIRYISRKYHTYLTDIILCRPDIQKSLTELDASYNSMITDVGVIGLSNLNLLIASRTGTTYQNKITEKSICKLHNLSSLDVRNNPDVSLAGIFGLKSIKYKLQYLCLCDNNFKLDPSELKKYFPNMVQCCGYDWCE